MSSIMEVEDILKILPHRYPFMLVDRIIELSEDGDRIVGLKNLSFNELFFKGIFRITQLCQAFYNLKQWLKLQGSC